MNRRRRWLAAAVLYRRDALVEVGGFSRDFSCEDIELTFRTHERFLREGRQYRLREDGGGRARCAR